MTKTYDILARKNISDEYDPTTLLTAVLVINFFLVIFLGFSSIFLLFYSVTQIATCSVHGINTVMWLLVAFVPFLMTFLYLKLILLLQEYNNTARLILLLIIVFYILFSLWISSYIFLFFSIFMIYVLAIHKDTRNLFTT